MAGPWEMFAPAADAGPWTQFAPAQQPPEEPQSFFRQVADVPLGVAKGAVQGVRMIADAFGAGTETSQTIKGAEEYLGGLMSAAAKKDQQEISRLMKDAEDKGVLDQVKAGFQAFATAPVDLLSQAFGTAVPVILGTLGAKLLGAGAGIATGVSALTGAGMGAGVVKGSIYEETKRALIEAGAQPEEAERRAQLAQEYGGKNLDQILLGTVLGGVAAVGPLEKGAAGALARRILGKVSTEEVAETTAEQAAKGALRRRAEAAGLEAVPEALQAGQEKVAQNIALQREGLEVPTFRGAAGAATLEGLAGAGLGAAVGRPQAAPEVEPPAPEAPPVEPPEPPAGALEYRPDPYFELPDGSVAKQSEIDAYLATLPEDQQAAIRAKMRPVGRPPESAPRPTMEGYPDKSVATREAAEAYIRKLPEDQRVAARARLLGLAPQPGTELSPQEIAELEKQQAKAKRKPTAEELIAKARIKTGKPTTEQDVARIRDEHETAVIEGLLAQDAEMQRANEIANVQREEIAPQAEPDVLGPAIAEVDQRVREGRIMARVQDLIDRNIPFASTAITDINDKLSVINEAPLTNEERNRIQNIMGMVNVFTGFVNLPQLPPRPVDTRAENQAMEALIKERKERGPTEPLRATPVAPSPRVEETSVSERVGEGAALRPEGGVEPSVTQDRELVAPTAVAKPAEQDYEARLVDRQQRIRNAKTLEDADAILNEEYADNERHYDGTTRLQRERRELQTRLEDRKAQDLRQKREDSGEWLRFKDAGSSASVASSEAKQLNDLNDGFEYKASPSVYGGWDIERRKKISAEPSVQQEPTPSAAATETTSTAPAAEAPGRTAEEQMSGMRDMFEEPAKPARVGTDEQIKSAIGNNGDYSITDPDIRKDVTSRKYEFLTTSEPAIDSDRIPSYKRGVETLRRKLDRGEITPEQFADRISVIARQVEAAKLAKEVPARERGADYIRQRLLEAKRRGDLSEEAVDFAEWFIQRNPKLVDDLAISIRSPKEGGIAGEYNTLARIATLMKDKSNDYTIVHEILHHLERMLPKDVQSEIRKIWYKSLMKAQKETKNETEKLFFKNIVDYHFGKAGKKEFDAAIKLLKDGAVSIDLYQFTDPSEFWADNASYIMGNRFLVKDSVLRKLKNWLSELKEKVKDLFGLNSQAPIIRALDSLAKGDGKFVSSEMIMPGPIQGADRKSVRDRATDNFLRWFGDSKVVNENGEPLVMYHGTTADISKFEARGDEKGGKGVWLTPDPEFASEFAFDRNLSFEEGSGTGGNVVPVYVKAEKIFDYDKPYHLSQLQNYLLEEYPSGKVTNTNGANVSIRNGIAMMRSNDEGMSSFLQSEAVFEAIQDIGFDGIYERFDGVENLVVFNPTQIKSAIGNNGDYSITEPDIRKSLGGIRDKAAKARADIIEAGRLGMQKRVPIQGGRLGEDINTAINKVFVPENATLADKIENFKDRTWQRIAQGVADQFRTIKDYSEKGYMIATTSKSVDGAMETLLRYGELYNDGGALNVRKDTKGLLEALTPLGKEVDTFFVWLALNREASQPKDKKSEFIDPETGEDLLAKLVAKRSELNQGKMKDPKTGFMVDRAVVYEKARKDMMKLNRSVLDIAHGKVTRKPGEKEPLFNAAIIDDEAFDKFINDAFFVPFYREMEGKGVESVRTASGLTGQQFSKALKGSALPFADLYNNVLLNWSHILSASMKNSAAVQTIEDALTYGGIEAVVPNLRSQFEWKNNKVYKAGTDELVGDGSLKFDQTTDEGKGVSMVMIDGNKTYFKVTDPLLFEAISAIGYLGKSSKFLDMATTLSQWLRFGVTVSPVFRINNLLRDPAAAAAVAGGKLGFTPLNFVQNTIEGIRLYDPKNESYLSALAGGGIFNMGYRFEGDQSKLIKKLQAAGIKNESILDSDKKIRTALKTLWNKYEEYGNKAESAQRLKLYKTMRDKDMSHLEAVFYARDLMDYSKQGAWPAVRILMQTVPFLNARTQGLYKLGRDGIIPTARTLYNVVNGKSYDQLTEEEKKQRITDAQKAKSFSAVAGAAVAASLLLYFMYKDDEDFKKRDAWDRDNFFWFKVPGIDYAFRIPKPFEIGALATIAERVTEQIVDENAEGKQFGDALSRMLVNTFAFDLPQVIRPAVDLYANKDNFTKAPIEGIGMERRSKAERMTPETSALGIAMSRVWNFIMPERIASSPVQMDYALQAYFGWLGATIGVVSNYAVMPFKDGEYPDARWMDRASLGLIKEMPGRSSGYISSFYENSKAINQAMADMRHYAGLGQIEKAYEIQQEKMDKIQLFGVYQKVSEAIANIRKQADIIKMDKTMSGAEKKQAIDNLNNLMSEYAKMAEDIRKQQKGGRP